MRYLLVFAILIAPISAAFQNEPTGFRGIEWGSNPTKYADELVEISRSKDGFVRFSRKKDKLAIGEAEIENITYSFYRGKFAYVAIRTKGSSNQRALLRTLQTQFGPSNQASPNIDRYIWSGARSRIGLFCNSIDHNCITMIGSNEVRRQQQADRKSRAEKAKADF
jgi:hypothetical protein